MFKRLKEKPYFRMAKCVFDNIVLKKPTPFILLFEPSQLCNCKCSFCYHWKEYDNHELTKEEIFSILKQAYDIGCRQLLLNGGEPFMGTYFKETVKEAKRQGYNVGITTNGWFLHSKIKSVAPYINNLTVSLDFPDSRHDTYRGLNGLYENVIKGIRESKKYVSNIKLNFSIHKENISEIENMLELARREGVGIYFRMLIQEHRDGTNMADTSLLISDKDVLKQTAQKLIELKKKGAPIVSSYSYLKHLRDMKPFKCLIARLIVNIDSHGRVYSPCPKHEGTKEYIFGSVREQPLKNIWFSEKAGKFRRFSEKCKPCMNCYSACIIEPSLIFKPYLSMWVEQLLNDSSITSFFKSSN